MSLSIRSDSDPLDPSLVQTIVSEITTQQYFQVATVALLVYDAIITMDKEVKFFWGASYRKPVTLVYFANRYIGIFGAVSLIFWDTYNKNLEICKFSDWTYNVSSWVTVVSIDYILMIRVLALYSQDKRLSAFLMSLLGLEATSKFAILVYSTWDQDCPIAKDATVCSIDTLPPFILGIIDWMNPMVYGLLLMALALYKAAEYWKMSAGFKGFKLVKVLIEDQAMYFLLAVSCCVLNIMQLKLEVENEFLSIFLEQAGSPSFLCILGSRMLINLKEVGKEGLNEGTSCGRESVSNMEFDQADRSEGSSNMV